MLTVTSGHNCALGSSWRAANSFCRALSTPPGKRISFRISAEATVSAGACPGVLIEVVTNHCAMMPGSSGWTLNISAP